MPTVGERAGCNTAVMTRVNVSSGGPYEEMYGYSRAVRVGDHVHVAGTTAEPSQVEGADAYHQAASAIRRIAASLEEVGASLADVVRTVTYVTDIADVDLIARAHKEAFGDVRPAATLVQVAALIDPSYVVEIEAYAIVES